MGLSLRTWILIFLLRTLVPLTTFWALRCIRQLLVSISSNKNTLQISSFEHQSLDPSLTQHQWSLALLSLYMMFLPLLMEPCIVVLLGPCNIVQWLVLTFHLLSIIYASLWTFPLMFISKPLSMFLGTSKAPLNMVCSFQPDFNLVCYTDSD